MGRYLQYARIFLGIILILISKISLAAPDLFEIYQQALMYDPVYQKARATRLAQGELLPQQVALLLPNISATGNVSWNRNQTLRSAPPSFVPPGITTYPAKSYLITVSQTLLNYNTWFLTKQARAVDKQANATLIAAWQDLITRVVRAYLKVLNDQDTLRYTEAERDANYRQLVLAKKRYQLGVDIITGIYNAQAAYDSSVADAINAKNNVQNSLIELKTLTGICYTAIAPLKKQFPLLNPCPISVSEWVCAASKYNWALIAARYGVIAAREQTKAIFSNHLPTIVATATHGPSYGQSTGLVDTVNNMVGLQVNVPIFQGGLVLSQTRQAEDQFVEQYADMEKQYQDATTSAQQRYNDIVTGVQQIKADRESVKSSNLSVSSTEQAYKVGTRSIFDVLISQKDLYRAQRELATDEYAYLLNTILLKQASGNLACDDVLYINQFLH